MTLRILLVLGIAAAMPGLVAQAFVNQAAIGCMSDVIASPFMEAALTGRPMGRSGGCAAARRLDGRSEAAIRWSAVGDVLAGNYESARDRLVHAAPPARDSTLQRFFLGLTAHALGHADVAIHEWASLDGDGRVLLAIAERLVGLGRADLALPYCRAAAAQRPDSADVRFRLAEALNMAGQVDEARADYRQGFASGSLPASTDMGEVAFHYAQILAGRREFGEAVAIMEKAIAARPRYPNYMGYLALIHVQSGEPARAVRWLDEAVKVAPASAYPYWEYGRFYMSRQMIGPAIAQFERAIRLDPGPAYYYGDLGAAYFAENRLQEAIGAWREACRRAPANATYRQWLAAAETAAQRTK